MPTGFMWSLPPGWGATAPYYYVTAAGAQSFQPTILFVSGTKQDPLYVTINQRQRMDALGPCEETSFGTLCRDDAVNVGDYNIIRSRFMEQRSGGRLLDDKYNDALRQLGLE